MSSTRQKIVAVILAGVAAGMGITLYYMLVVAPRGEERAMQRQVKDWGEQKWTPLRRCILGDAPPLQNGHDAMLVRAITDPTSVEGSGCREHFEDLERPGTTSTGVAAVEEDWHDLRGAIALLQNRYHTLEANLESIVAVGEALEQVDAAYAKLRHDAGMDPVTPPGRASVPELSWPEPIRESLHFASVSSTPGALRAWQGGSEITFFTIRGPDRVTVRREQAPRPDQGDWSARTETTAEGTVRVVAVPDAPPSMEPVPEPEVVLEKESGTLRPFVAGQRGDQRWILIEDEADSWGANADVVIAQSTAGEPWSHRRIAGVTEVRVDGRYRVDVFLRSYGSATWWVGLPPDRLPTASAQRLASSGVPSSVCTGSEASWMVGERLLQHAPAPGQPVTQLPLDAIPIRILGCSDAQALVWTLDDQVYFCDAERCARRLALSQLARTPVATLHADAPMLAAAISDLLLLWRTPAGPSEIYRLTSDNTHLEALAQLGGTTFVLIDSVDGARLVPLEP